MKNLKKKVPYQGSKKYLMEEPYKVSKKKYLIKNLKKKVPYQGSKKSTLSRKLIKNLKKVPYQGSKKCIIKLV